jgi:hypothetical protein
MSKDPNMGGVRGICLFIGVVATGFAFNWIAAVAALFLVIAVSV